MKLPLDWDHTPADYAEAVEMLRRARRENCELRTVKPEREILLDELELNLAELKRHIQKERESNAALRNEVLEECAQICEQQADAIDGRLPNAFGGNFAKKFAANGLRGAAALIRANKGRR